MARITIEQINEELQQDNWKCLSSNYTNLDTPLKFQCNEGHDIEAPWKKIRAKRFCPVCASNEYTRPSITAPIPKHGKQRILALDQSSHITGWSIFDDNKLVAYGIFDTKKGEEAERANTLRMWFIAMVENWKPDYIGFEGIQFQNTSEGDATKRMGVTVFQTLARIQGVLMEAAYSLHIPFEFCSTNTWRNFNKVKGRTRTDKKRSMQMIIKERYDINVSDDIADAIGIGTYLANKARCVIEVENWEED